MVKWKSSDVERITGSKPEPHSRAVKLPQVEPAGLQFIKNHLKFMGIDYVTEFKFHPKRRFRFDVAIPSYMIAIEYEGLNSEKSGHTTLTGYTKDCEKYNLAQVSGWKVLRYTAINYKSFDIDLQKATAPSL